MILIFDSWIQDTHWFWLTLFVTDDGNFWFPDSGYTLTLFDHTSTNEIIFDWAVSQKDQEFLSYGMLVEPTGNDDTFKYEHKEGDTTGNTYILCSYYFY